MSDAVHSIRSLCKLLSSYRERERERDTERQRERQRDRERQTETETERGVFRTLSYI